MCNDHKPVSFDDLEDKAFWDEDAPAVKPVTNAHVEDISNVEIPGFVEDCPKCRGTGVFTGYSGRSLGKCFKCKGTGKLQFKTSPEARAKSRTSARKRTQRKAEETKLAFWGSLNSAQAEFLKQHKGDSFFSSLIAGGEKYGHLTEKQLAIVNERIAQLDDVASGEYAENHPEIMAWLKAEIDNGNEFAGSLMGSIARYGSLSERQEAAVLRNLESAKEMPTSDLDISSLKGYFAVPDGDTRLKLRIRQPGKNSRWYGWTYVDDGAEYGRRTTYGKQAPDGTYQGRLQDELRAILADPMAAQVAYGKLTGVCGRCGRILEDEASVAAGIGPVCATKV